MAQGGAGAQQRLLSLALVLLRPLADGHRAGVEGSNATTGFEDECNPVAGPTPCCEELGANNVTSASCSFVCTRLESALHQCSITCTEDEHCGRMGSDVQCLRLEPGAEVGYCSSRQYWWIAGVIVSLAGSLLSNLGLQIQKLGHQRQQQQIVEGVIGQRHDCCNKIWVCGFITMVSGAALDFGSLAFAAQSLLAPLAVSGILINIIQAPFVVGESPSRQDIFASVVLASGCVVAIAFADHDTKTYSLQDMLQLWKNGVFLAWISLVFVLMLVGFRFLRLGQLSAPGARNGLAKAASRLEESQAAGSNAYPLVYSALAGQSGGNSILFAKSIGEVFKTIAQVGISGGDLAISAFMVVGMAGCVFLQLRTLNEGLRRFDALFILPIYQAFWIMGATVNGMLFFEEYINFSALQYSMFTVGCLLAVAGVAYLGIAKELVDHSRGLKDDQLTNPALTEALATDGVAIRGPRTARAQSMETDNMSGAPDGEESRPAALVGASTATAAESAQDAAVVEQVARQANLANLANADGDGLRTHTALEEVSAVSAPLSPAEAATEGRGRP